MRIFDITEDQFLQMVLQVGGRPDWPIVVSTNCLNHEWSFRTRGWTPLGLRDELRGLFPVLDNLAEEYGIIREERGRLFINRNGAFYKIFELQYVQFAAFRFVG